MFLGPFLNYEAQRATSNSMETSTEGTDPWSISARLKVDSPDLEMHPRPVCAEPQVPAPVSSLHFQICCGEWGVMLQTWEQLKIDISPNRFTCMGSYSLERVACLGRMILTVSPGWRPQSVGSGWSHDFLHLSFIGLSFVSTCLPLWAWLVA